MSGAFSKSKQNSSSTQNSSQTFDPDIKAALLANVQGAQQRAAGLQYQPIIGADIQGFQNPYTSSVVDATNAQMEQARQQAISSGHATAVGQSAFGGSRTGVLDALTNKDYMAQMASTDASLNSAGYDKALTAAQNQNGQQNQWQFLIQQMLNQSLGLLGNQALTTSTGSSQGSGSSFSISGGK